MGVKGLQSYVENYCPGGLVPVNIGLCAQQYRKKTGKDAVLIVDLSNCIPNLYRKLRLNNLNGGELKEFVATFMHLLQRFKQLNIQCVLFADGPRPKEREELGERRKKERLNQHEKVLAAMAEGDFDEAEKRSRNLRPIGLKHFLFSTLRAENISVKQTVREADDEILEFIAEQGGCFGVLSGDSDFIIAEGIENHFSIRHLDLRNLKTMLYVRRALSAHLNLHPKYLPLLATLSGNDVINHEMLCGFHSYLNMENERKLGKNSFLDKYELLPKIALWINENANIDGENWAQEVAHKIGSPELADDIKRSVDSYILRTPSNTENKYYETENCSLWERIIHTSEIMLRNHFFFKRLHKIMIGQKDSNGHCLQLNNIENYQSTGILLEKLNVRLYGILLFEQSMSSREQVAVEVKSDRVSPVYPDNHPGLLNLWCDPNFPVDEKWRLLCWAVSDKLSMQKVRDLPGQVQIPAMALYFLCYEVEEFLKPWEVAALVAQAVMLMTMTVSQLRGLRFLVQDDVAVHISSVYQKTVHQIEAVAQACGEPVSFHYFPGYVFYDGNLFHQTYMALKGGRTGADLCGEEDIMTYMAVMRFLYPTN